MHKLAGARRRPFSKIVLLAEQDLEAAASGVAGDAGPIYSAADHRDIDQPRDRSPGPATSSSSLPAALLLYRAQ